MTRTTTVDVATKRRLATLCAGGMVTVTLLTGGGCRTLGSRSAAPAALAACRDLTQQGTCAIEQGDWQQAEAILSKAVETNPHDDDARRNYAETLWRRGAHDEAIGQMSAALADGGDAQARVRAGEMLLAIGKVDRAGQRADEALNQNPTLAAAWALRGRVGRARGEFDRALADLHRSLDFEPNDAGVLLDVAELYGRQNRPQRALATVQHLLDHCGSGDAAPQALYHQGLAYAQMQRHAEAADSLELAARKGAVDAELFFQLGRARSALGQTQIAREALRRALALDPNHGASAALMAEMAPDGPVETLAGLEGRDTAIR